MHASTTGTVSEIGFGYDAMRCSTARQVEDQRLSDYEKTYYIYDVQGNLMAIYSENSACSVVITRQEEQARTTQVVKMPRKRLDRLGLVRRNLEMGDQAECPYCPASQTVAPGQLRIVEVGYDSPEKCSTEVNFGEYVTLRNMTGLRLPLASIEVAYPGGTLAFGGSDFIKPNGYLIIAYGSGTTPQDKAGFIAANDLPPGLSSNPDVTWYWQVSHTLGDGGGALELTDNSGPAPTLLDEVDFGVGGIVAANDYCGAPPVYSVQLDDVFSPSGAFDMGHWLDDVATGLGQQGAASFMLENSYERELGLREYELKDHLGNVRVVITDRKLSTINVGTSLPEDFRADVLLERDFYAFGMEAPGATFTPDAYRYGFNGMERDDEVFGAGHAYAAEFWEYDPRIGKRWNPDPVFNANYSSYSTFGNNPVFLVDPNGAEPWHPEDDGSGTGSQKLVADQGDDASTLKTYLDKIGVQYYEEEFSNWSEAILTATENQTVPELTSESGKFDNLVGQFLASRQIEDGSWKEKYVEGGGCSPTTFNRVDAAIEHVYNKDVLGKFTWNNPLYKVWQGYSGPGFENPKDQYGTGMMAKMGYGTIVNEADIYAGALTPGAILRMQQRFDNGDQSWHAVLFIDYTYDDGQVSGLTYWQQLDRCGNDGGFTSTIRFDYKPPKYDFCTGYKPTRGLNFK